MSADQTFTAVVVRSVTRGKHGPYAVVAHPELGYVTISLSPPVWKEDERPAPGTYVVYWDLRRKRAGWRAERARFYRPADAITASKAKE